MRCNQVLKHNLIAYIANHYNFCFGPLANALKCQPIPNKYPGLAPSLNVVKKLRLDELRTRLRLRPIKTCFVSFKVKQFY